MNVSAPHRFSMSSHLVNSRQCISHGVLCKIFSFTFIFRERCQILSVPDMERHHKKIQFYQKRRETSNNLFLHTFTAPKTQKQGLSKVGGFPVRELRFL